MKRLLDRISGLSRHRGSRSEHTRLSSYPALRGATKEVLDDIASWADEIHIESGETIRGAGGVNRWSYLVADPEATVIEAGRARPVGQALGLAQALRVDAGSPGREVMACDALDLLAIPPTRVDHLIQLVPGLVHAALDEWTEWPIQSSRAGDRSLA